MRKFSTIIVLLVGSLLQASHARADVIPSMRRFLIKKFAPLVIFHPKEAYYPCSVSWFIERSSLQVGTGSGVQTITEYPTMEDLVKYPGGGNPYFLAIKGDSAARHLTQRGEPLVNGESVAPVYANLVEKEDGIVIQYLFFHAFNGSFNILGLSWKDFGSHEGDWEHIDVHLNGKNRNAEMTQIYYAAHGADNYGQYVEGDKIPRDGTHPRIYSSYYGHASYPNVFRLNAAMDRTGSGVLWKTWQNAVDVGTINKPTPSNEWITFGGRWGKDGGPRTPSYGGWWRSVPNELELFFNESLRLVHDKDGKKVWESKNFKLGGKVPNTHKKLYWKITNPQSPRMTFTVQTRGTFRRLWRKGPTYGPFPGDGAQSGIFNKSDQLYIVVESDSVSDRIENLEMLVYGIGE